MILILLLTFILHATYSELLALLALLANARKKLFNRAFLNPLLALIGFENPTVTRYSVRLLSFHLNYDQEYI